MKILFVADSLGYGSLLYWDNILSGLKNKFNEVRVFTREPSLKTINEKVKTESVLKGLTIHLPVFVFKIREYKPSIIILNEFSINSFFTIVFKFLYRKSKILLLVESDPFLGYTNEHSKLRNFYRKLIANNVDGILTNNELGFNYLQNVLKINKYIIRVAPYLVSNPGNSLIKKDVNVSKRKINFLYVGQLIPRKGLIFLLKEISSLPIEIKDKISFQLIGTGVDYDELFKFKQIHNLDCVEFLGNVAYDKISYYYTNTDCFVLPTLHDYRALVGFEALSFGCPIIASKFDGARFEIVNPNENGYIINPRKKGDIKNAIISLVQDEKKINLFRSNSMEIKNKYTLANGVKNLIKTIEEL